MDDLIVRSLRGELTAEEQHRLRTWRGDAHANEVRYRSMARTWELTGLVAPAAVVGSGPPSVESILARADREGRSSPPVPERHRRRTLAARWAPMAAAAAAALVLGVGGHRMLQPAGPVAAGGLAGTEFLTGPAERVTVRLSDGTYTRLGPSTRLRILDTVTSREVWLDGAAFFAVAHDPTRPFTVRTRSGDAAVLGTRFQVQASEDDLRLVVVEGRVALTVDQDRVEVGASETTAVVAGRLSPVVRVDEVFGLLDGMDGVLLFQETPLSLVAREVEARFGLEVEVAPEVEASTVTAAFSDEDPEVVMTAVCRVAAVVCELDERRIRIRPGN